MGIQELSIVRPKSSKNKEFNLSMHHLLHQMFKVYGKKSCIPEKAFFKVCGRKP